MRSHGQRLYCVLCDVARELKPSRSDPLNMPSSSSNRFRAQNSLCSLYKSKGEYRMVDQATFDLSSIIKKLASLPSKQTTLQMIKHGDLILEELINCKSLKGVSHLRGVLCVQLASGMQLIPPDFFNYAAVTNSLGPHKFFERATSCRVSKQKSKDQFFLVLRELKKRQPKLYPHVKGIENTCCIIGKEDEGGKPRPSPEFIFCEKGVNDRGDYIGPEVEFDRTCIHNFFKWKEATTAYPSELVILHCKKWVPLVGLFRPFYGAGCFHSRTKFVPFFSKKYQQELKNSTVKPHCVRQLLWASTLPSRYPQDPFGEST